MLKTSADGSIAGTEKAHKKEFKRWETKPITGARGIASARRKYGDLEVEMEVRGVDPETLFTEIVS